MVNLIFIVYLNRIEINKYSKIIIIILIKWKISNNDEFDDLNGKNENKVKNESDINSNDSLVTKITTMIITKIIKVHNTILQ